MRIVNYNNNLYRTDYIKRQRTRIVNLCVIEQPIDKVKHSFRVS